MSKFAFDDDDWSALDRQMNRMVEKQRAEQERRERLRNEWRPDDHPRHRSITEPMYGGRRVQQLYCPRIGCKVDVFIRKANMDIQVCPECGSIGSGGAGKWAGPADHPVCGSITEPMYGANDEQLDRVEEATAWMVFELEAAIAVTDSKEDVEITPSSIAGEFLLRWFGSVFTVRVVTKR